MRRPRTTSTPSTRTSSMRHLWRIEVATRAETRVTSGDFSLLSYELSADGRRVAHHRAPSTGARRRRSRRSVGDGCRRRQRRDADPATPCPRAAPASRPTASQVLFLSGSNERFETYYNANLFVMPSGGGTARDLTKDFGYEITDAAWSQGRPGDLRHRQHGRAQPALRDPGRGRHAQGADQRQPRDRRLDLRARAATVTSSPRTTRPTAATCSR